MKAEINSKGVLKITPETELELYALKKWTEENEKYTRKSPVYCLGHLLNETESNKISGSSIEDLLREK